MDNINDTTTKKELAYWMEQSSSTKEADFSDGWWNYAAYFSLSIRAR